MTIQELKGLLDTGADIHIEYCELHHGDEDFYPDEATKNVDTLVIIATKHTYPLIQSA